MRLILQMIYQQIFDYQLSETMQSGEFLGRLIGSLLRTGVPLW